MQLRGSLASAGLLRSVATLMAVMLMCVLLCVPQKSHATPVHSISCTIANEVLGPPIAVTVASNYALNGTHLTDCACATCAALRYVQSAAECRTADRLTYNSPIKNLTTGGRINPNGWRDPRYYGRANPSLTALDTFIYSYTV